MDKFFQILLCLCVLEFLFMGIRAAPLENATDVNTPPEGLLTNLGEIALKMSEQITNSEDETLNVPQLSEFVKALSKATVLITHPEIAQSDANQDEVDTVKHLIADQTTEMRQLKEKLEEKIQQTQTHVATLELELNKTRVLSQRVREQYMEQSSPVGFTAIATINQMLVTSTIVKFNEVLFNYGGHYNRDTGLFTCPVTGLYLVSVKLEEYDSNGLRFEVIVDEVTVLDFSDATDVYDLSLSGSTLAECEEGGSIYVQSLRNGQLNSFVASNVISVLLMSKLDK